MKKRLLFFFVGLVCSLVAMADNVGFTSTITDGHVSAPVVTTGAIEVQVVRGTQNTGTGKGSMFWGSTNELTFDGRAERTKSKEGDKITIFNNDCWTGASFKIPAGYTFEVTAIQVDIAGQDYEWGYKVELVNGDGTVVSKIASKTGRPKAANKIQAKASGLSCSLSGTATLKVYYHVNTNSDSKYMAVPELYLTGTLKEAAAQTKYTKPSITQGAYDQSTGTYPVTFSTQNEEVGVINYTVGTGAKVTGVASGTTINVAPSTTVTATVSGSSFDESIEATLTTPAAPKHTAPLILKRNFDFATFKYTISLSGTGTIKYSVNDGDYAVYTEPLALAPGDVIKTYAEMTNMSDSDVRSYTVPAAPSDGESTTPTTAGTYSSGTSYNAGAFTIPSSIDYIGGQISSGNSSINGAIKMRLGRNADPAGSQNGKYGFPILVNTGYTLSEVSLKMLNNYDTKIALVGVYVDNSTENSLAAPVALPYASAKTVEAVNVVISNIAAKEKVVFVFDKTEGTDTPNQGQIIISAKGLVPVYNTSVTTDKFATIYYDKELVCPDGTKAYTGIVEYIGGDITLKLNELTDGIIPANTPAIIAGDGGLFTVGTTNATFSGINDLKGTLEEKETSSVGGTVCVLGYEDGKSGFYRFDGDKLAANKAYLVFMAPPAKKISIVMDGEATGINTVNAKAKNCVMYNLAGQRVNANAKGLVIVNGKVVNMK